MLHRETGRGKRDAKSNYDRHYREGLPAASNYRKLKFRSRLAPAVRPPREIMRVANRSLACTARERERGSQPRRLASSFPPLLPLDATPPIDSRSLAVSRVAYQRATRENHLSSLLLLLLLLLLSLVYFASSIVRNEDKVSNDSPRSTRPEIIFHLNSPVSRLTRIGVIDS